ncbi:lipoprotein signal peptidase [Roseobacter cerasinus]|uniref:Lipoprotein signal peptidase n=1 Tax=Roseobacter cerasinus TaxID=2602289 RepID=A0A640VPW9_9RHOB|nr:signal peptidase II [Roseobacter cerasinus]GFE49131.1 lipoprotein signal peptidase [Roseobacter cerasinus]
MRALASAAVVAFIVDQLSKYLVIHQMELWRVQAIDVLPPLLNFRYGENRGINFGLFSDGSDASRWVLIGLAVVICAAVLIWVRRQQLGLWPQVGAGLLIGGALANVLDRLLYGYVLDFLNMSCCGIDNPFVFNIADVFIFGGAILLVFLAPDPKDRSKKGQ